MNKYIYGLLFLAIVVRVYTSLKVGFWIDEVFDFYTARDNRFMDLLLGRHYDAAHPPLFFIINKILIFVWQDITLTRFISILVSTIGLWKLVMWLKSDEEGWRFFDVFTLLLLAFSFNFVPLHLIAQSYPWVFTLVVFSITYSFKCVYTDSDLKWRSWVLLGGLYFLTFFMDYSGLWALVSLAAFFFLQAVLGNIPREKILFLIKAFALSMALFLIWSPVFFQNLEQAFSLEAYLNVMGGYRDSNPWISPLRFWMPWFTGNRMAYINPIFLFIASFVGMIYIIRKNSKLGVFLLILFFLPIALSHSYSVLSGKAIFHSRNLWVSSLSILLGYAGFGAFLFHQLRLKTLAWAFVLVLVGTYIYDFPSLGHRPFLHIGNEEGAAKILNHLNETEHWNSPRKAKIVLLSNFKPYRLANIVYHIERKGHDVEFPHYTTLYGHSEFAEVKNKIRDKKVNLEGKHVYLVNIHADISVSERLKFDTELMNWALEECRKVERLGPTEKMTFAAKCHI